MQAVGSGVATGVARAQRLHVSPAAHAPPARLAAEAPIVVIATIPMRRILLVDDHRLFADAATALLIKAMPDLRVRVATSCEDALAQKPGVDFDVVVLDLGLPGIRGEGAFDAIRRRFVDVPILVVSSELDASLAVRLIRRGARGFVPKDTPAPILVAALQLVFAGGTYIPPIILTQTADRSAEFEASVTPRQRAVLLELVRGRPTADIARSLGMSEATVRVHVSAVMKLAGVTTRAELLASALTRRLTEAAPDVDAS